MEENWLGDIHSENGWSPSETPIEILIWIQPLIWHFDLIRQISMLNVDDDTKLIASFTEIKNIRILIGDVVIE